MKKIETEKIQAIGGLFSAYQTAKVLIKGRIGEVGSKLGLEIEMIPIINGKELRRYKPKSFFINKNEIQKWDGLILDMIKMRWRFAKQEKLFDPEFMEELMNYYMKNIREAMEKGLKE